MEEQVVDEDGESGAGVGDAVEGGIVKEDEVEDIEEESKGELIKVVEEMQLVEDEEDRAAGLGER